MSFLSLWFKLNFFKAPNMSCEVIERCLTRDVVLRKKKEKREEGFIGQL